jgi:hypothetical protein
MNLSKTEVKRLVAMIAILKSQRKKLDMIADDVLGDDLDPLEAASSSLQHVIDILQEELGINPPKRYRNPNLSRPEPPRAMPRSNARRIKAKGVPKRKKSAAI